MRQLYAYISKKEIKMKQALLLACTVFTHLAITHAAISETPLHIRTSQSQKSCAAAGIGSSAYVLTWSSYLHDGKSGAIVARRFDHQGAPLGAEFRVNQTTAGNQTAPAVASTENGDILIAWQSPVEAEDNDIMARIYDPNGQAQTGEFRVNSHTMGEQSLPRVTGCVDGSFLIAWESEDLPEHNRKAICLRRVTPAGVPIGQELIASDTPKYTCRHAGITGDALGDYAVTWLEDRTTNAVRRRRFGPDDAPLGPSIQVNSLGFKSLTWPNCSMNESGFCAITWDGDPNAASKDNIHARIYDPNGAPVGDAFQVNTTSAGSQRNPTTCMNAGGNLVIAWDSETDENQRDIKARLFDLQGQALTEEYRVNTFLPEDQAVPVAVLGRERNLLIAWQSKNQDGSDWGVYGSFGPVLQSSDLNGDGHVDFRDFRFLGQHWQSPPSMESDLHQDHRLDDLDIWTFCTQWLQTAEE